MRPYEKRGPPAKAHPVSTLPKCCPKCGNKVMDQNTGYPWPVDYVCHKCGLTSESNSFYDALKNEWREL